LAFVACAAVGSNPSASGGPLLDKLKGKTNTDSSAAATVPAGTAYTMKYGGIERKYYVYVPSSYNGKDPLPVVFNFHGGVATSANQMRTSQMNPVADRHGFMVVYVDGTGKRGKLLTFNAGNCCGYAQKAKIDDVGLIRTLLDSELPKQYKIDSKRVYATGFSNGGELSYRLAIEMADRFAAVASVAGDISFDNGKPSRAVPVIHFHGMKDNNCPWEGGLGSSSLQGVPHRSIPDTLAMWKKWDNCQDAPVKTETGSEYTMERYEPAAGQSGAPVVVYKFPEGGHTWPGGVDPALGKMKLGKVITSVNASEIMWQFFSQYSLP
jgi:polyhydroxybutyrate depolymerase